MDWNINKRYLYLEITDICNLDCPMCGTRQHRDGKVALHLTREFIRDEILIAGNQLGFSGFVISGGEPTLVSHLLDTLKDAVILDYDIILATNLLQMKRSRFEEILKVLDDNRHLIQISFDSHIPSEMNAIRGKDVYEVVIANCRNIVDLRKEVNTATQLGAVTVIQQENVDSIIDTVRFILDQLCFDIVKLQLKHDYNSSITPNNYRHQKKPEYGKEMLARLFEVCEQVFNMARKDSRILPEHGELNDWKCFLTDPLKISKKCMSHISVYIDAYGNYRGCIFGEVIGNIHNISLRDYLRSKEYSEFLKFVEVCNICTHGCS